MERTLCNLSSREQMLLFLGGLAKQEHDISIALGTLDLPESDRRMLADLGTQICPVKEELLDSI